MSERIIFSDNGDKRVKQAIEKAQAEIKKDTGKDKVSKSVAIRTILIEYAENKKEDDNRNHSDNNSRVGDKG